MVIYLKDIPEGGRSFDVSQTDSEIAEQLRDLLDHEPFSFSFELIPAGQAYDLKGKIQATLPVVCAFCATDFTVPVEHKVRELLMQEDKPSAKGVEGDAEMGLQTEVTMLKSPHMDVGDILHEQIALLAPYQPKCKEDCKGLCHVCGADLNQGPCGCPDQKIKKESAFSVLKNLKLN